VLPGHYIRRERFWHTREKAEVNIHRSGRQVMSALHTAVSSVNPCHVHQITMVR